ncbi:hypothetical protein NW752_001241 [Fusarium irregulare]|uniref:3CxxC-type domain-containing protein n=1 Tax=Fusarium irregulare TaxID=2494466 RepID=A0A9W8U4U8_9HYPO|nr:hypothetical protein NW766_010819 [Fusarium irregulare]KAJ4026302.1 hypothetical protein NW752_001241 [Fusarium irregulare]
MSDSDSKAALLKELSLRFQNLSLDENSAQNRWSQYSASENISPFSAALEKLMAEKSAPEEASPEHSLPETLSREESSAEDSAPEKDAPKSTSTELTLPTEASPVKVSPETASPDEPSTEEPPTKANSLEKDSPEETALENRVPEELSASKPAPKAKEQTEWFMCSYFDEQVRLQLAEDGIGYYTFNPDDDDDSATNSYSTNIMGRFACSNKRCGKTIWRSLLVAITIRVYDGYRYNAKVYNQRCISCGRAGDPMVDKRSYVDRVSYRIKKWHGIQMGSYQRGKDIPADGRHKSKYCEGCKKGLCNGRYDRDEEDSD